MNFKRYVEASDTWVDSHYVMGTSTDTITTPADIYANDTTATVGLKGNMSQTGTPTPTTPIQPQGTGERTGNLWNAEGFSARAITSTREHTDTNTYGTTLSTTIGKEVIITQSEYPTGTVGYQNGFFFIDVDFSKYEIGDKVTLSFDYICNEVHSIEGQISTTLYAGKNSNGIPVVLSSGKWSVSGRLTAVITVTADMNPYVEVRLCGNSITVKNIMLNLGSTALPYEPFGYKIPISSGGVNLFDKDNADIVDLYPDAATREIKQSSNLSTWSIILPVEPSTTYTFTMGEATTAIRRRVGMCSDYPTKGAYCTSVDDTPEYDHPNLGNIFTTDADTKYVLIMYVSGAGRDVAIERANRVQVVKGSTALPYEPYIEPTETNIYLGEVQTTRKIVKRTFNGSESFSLGSVIGQIRFNTGLTLIDNGAICSHYILKETYSSTGKPYIRLKSNTIWFELDDTGYETKEACLADFITYLQQQYAAGTPVTVWYVLATETTGIVNEPLRKIGNYADALSNVSIPVTAGANTISVDTTLQPSEVTVNYKGWHPVADVHEKSVNLVPPLAEWVDGYVNQSDGSITPPGGTTKEKTSDYIAIQAGQGYSFSRTGSFPVGGYGAWRGIGWYDSNKAFISRAQGGTQDALSTSAPSNAAYCRICFRTYGETTDTMFNKGLTALPYEPYWT